MHRIESILDGCRTGNAQKIAVQVARNAENAVIGVECATVDVRDQTASSVFRPSSDGCTSHCRHHRLLVRTPGDSRRGARNIRVFGSVARGEDNTSSNIDLLADLDAEAGGPENVQAEAITLRTAITDIPARRGRRGPLRGAGFCPSSSKVASSSSVRRMLLFS